MNSYAIRIHCTYEYCINNGCRDCIRNSSCYMTKKEFISEMISFLETLYDYSREIYSKYIDELKNFTPKTGKYKHVKDKEYLMSSIAMDYKYSFNVDIHETPLFSNFMQCECNYDSDWSGDTRYGQDCEEIHRAGFSNYIETIALNFNHFDLKKLLFKLNQKLLI